MEKREIENADGSALMTDQVLESQKGGFRCLLDRSRVSLRAEEEDEKWSRPETSGIIMIRVRGVHAELSSPSPKCCPTSLKIEILSPVSPKVPC